ncbi:MAG: radical SAM protein [bacterium]|nr:radical SAM protein [bacterium]
MKTENTISDHQLVALEDQFSRKHTYLRIAVTDRCNLQCVYCMPNESAEWKRRNEILTFEEILRIAWLLINNGITKIRLTGGEPLVRSNLNWLVSELAKLPVCTRAPAACTLYRIHAVSRQCLDERAHDTVARITATTS